MPVNKLAEFYFANMLVFIFDEILFGNLRQVINRRNQLVKVRVNYSIFRFFITPFILLQSKFSLGLRQNFSGHLMLFPTLVMIYTLFDQSECK